MRKNVRTFSMATYILLTLGIYAQAQPTLITEVPKASTNFVTAGNLVYFTSRDSLLRTNGTDEGTILLKSGFIRQSGFASSFTDFTEFNGMLFFISGNGLWRSDGTPSGTIQLITRNELQIFSGTGGILFFQGSDAATGRELYKTNGTLAGTTMVKDINPGAGNGFLPLIEEENNPIMNGEYYFTGNKGDGGELWKSDGTAAGTVMVKDIRPSFGNSYDHGGPLTHNNLLFFSASTATHGMEPWVSDGTSEGTFMIKDIAPGPDWSNLIHYGIGLNGAVYFITLPPANQWGNEDARHTLWKTSGTNESTVELAQLGDPRSTFADPFRIYKNKVYFFERIYGGPHLLKVTDGTPGGTSLVFNVQNYEGFPQMNFFDVVGDYLMFYGTADGYPTPFFRSDGTSAGTREFTRFNSAGYLSHPRDLTEVADLIFYGDHDGPAYEGNVSDPDDYFHLIQSDGVTTASMRTIYGVSTIDTDNITDYNGIVLFTARNDQNESTDKQKYVWIYDPNSSGNEQAGKIQQEVWNNVPGTRVSSIPVNTEPSSVKDLTIFEIPSNAADNYASRVRGYVVAPETGNYTFWIASDDQSQVWLSSDDNPANKKKIAEVTGWTTSRQWDKYPSQKSAVISLVANKKYYIEALHKEGTGGDNLAVGWQLPGGTMERPIPGNRLIPFGASENNPPQVSITAPEDGQSFSAPADIVISVSASDADGNITKVEFYNGTVYLGVDVSSPYSLPWNDVGPGNYTVIAKAFGDDGDIASDTINISVTGSPPCPGAGRIYQEFWTNVTGTRVSDIPIHTEPDFTQERFFFEGPVSPVGDNYGSRIRGYICPPASGQYIFWISGDDQVELSLSTDDNPANKRRIAYHTGWTNEREWTKYATQQSASITLQGGQRYYIEALMKEGLKADHVSVGWQFPNGTFQRPIAAVHLIPFAASDPDPVCAGSGTISVETWTGIDGTHVSSIPVNSSPNLTGERNIFEAPTNVGNNFGSRFRGYVCVPTTGNYTFWIASDDHSELWLSTDADPANKRRIAYHTGWTSPRQWTKYTTQQSAPTSLVAGQQYYIEALYKEDEGGDNMAVGWQLPDGTMERPIPGNRLSPFNSGATMAMQNETTSMETSSAESDLYSRISIYPNPARSGDPELTISGYEGIDKTIETQVEIINITGDVVFAERILCGGNCSSYLMNVNKQLVPGVYLVNMSTNGVRSSKRLLVK